MLNPNFCCNSFNNFIIPAWTVTSKAVVGSSAINNSGSHNYARAIMTLCRIPPDNSCGY